MGFEGFLSDANTTKTVAENFDKNLSAESFEFLNKSGKTDKWIFASMQEKDESLIFLTQSDYFTQNQQNTPLVVPDFLQNEQNRSVLFDASRYYSQNQTLDGWCSKVKITEEISNKLILGLLELDSRLFLTQILLHLFSCLTMDKIISLCRNEGNLNIITQCFLSLNTLDTRLLEICLKKVVFIPNSAIALQILHHLFRGSIFNRNISSITDEFEMNETDAMDTIENFCWNLKQQITDHLFQSIDRLNGNNFVTTGMMFFVWLFKDQNYTSLDMTVLQTCWMVDSAMKMNSHLVTLWSMLKIRFAYNCRQLTDVIICPLFQIIDKDNDDPFQVSVTLDDKVVTCLETVFKQKDASLPSWQYFWKLVHLKENFQINAVLLITSTTLYCSEAMKCNDIESKVVSALSYRDSHIIRYLLSESVIDLFEEGYERLGLFLCNREERFFKQLEHHKDLVEKVLVSLCRFTNKPMERCGNFIKKLAHIISSPSVQKLTPTITHTNQPKEEVIIHVETDNNDLAVDEETPIFQTSQPINSFNTFNSFNSFSQPTRKIPQFVPSNHQNQQPLINKSRRGTNSSGSLLDRIMNQPKPHKSIHWLPYPTSSGSTRPFFDSVTPYSHGPKHAFTLSPSFE